MKEIICDSLYAHISMFAITVLTLLVCVRAEIITPLWFVILGVNCFFLVMLAAMRIADFEMSEIGHLVKDYENGRFSKIDAFIK